VLGRVSVTSPSIEILSSFAMPPFVDPNRARILHKRRA
jgi:hypothetical protein